MGTKKLKVQMNGGSDEFYSPREAAEILLPYLDPGEVIWECAKGRGHLAKYLSEMGFQVVGDSAQDFLKATTTPNRVTKIITNPPFSKKEEFLAKCYELGKPFALLMPITALEGKQRGKLYRRHGIELIIPNKRFNFITPSDKSSGCWFATAWFCWHFNLPNQLNFVEALW